MIKEDANTLTPTADSWATSTVSYSYDAGHVGLVGELLETRLLSIGEDPKGGGAGSDFSVEFDNVTCTTIGP